MIDWRSEIANKRCELDYKKIKKILPISARQSYIYKLSLNTPARQ